MVTLDADGGAFRPREGMLASPRFALKYAIPSEFLESTYTGRLKLSAPMSALTATPMWSDIGSIVNAKYQVNDDLDSNCESTKYECKTVSIFNQYPKGADQWGTASPLWRLIYDSIKTMGDSAKLLDEAAKDRAVDFINNYFAKDKTDNKRKRFPAVFSVYLAGLDHDAHLKGMGKDEYVDFFKDSTDPRVEDIVKALKGQDEFDNKIFITVADHGHTQMPENLTYKAKEKILGSIDVKIEMQAEMSCELKLDFAEPSSTDDDSQVFDAYNRKEAERNNNNLHIWELVSLFAQFPDPNMPIKVLVSEQIAKLAELAAVATSDINQANIVAALNGPMAHIYIKGANWQDSPDEATMDSVLINLYSILKEGAAATGKLTEKINEHFPKLGSSIDTILVRWTLNGSYEVVTGISEDASGDVIISTDTLESLSNTGYQKAVDRITNMNHKDRSGDIILLMKDSPTGNVIDRFSTAYACKSWHGSLNSSDSYVPFIISYPGGDKSELDPFLNTVCPSNICEGNWKLRDLIEEIMKKQYSGQ
jgi:hypothetical protein